MEALSQELLEVRTSDDIVTVRHTVRRVAMAVGFGLVDQTKIVTASSELARNLVTYGGGGTVAVEKVENGSKKGVRLIFEDQGPGIPDIPLALTDGYTTGGGMGLGLGGAKRLSDEFDVQSTVGVGTRIALIRWRGR